jgi:CheY-like chemotaxis protein
LRPSAFRRLAAALRCLRSNGGRGAASDPDHKRILLVDDDRASQAEVAENLAQRGYVLQTADTAERALDLWRRGGIDLVLVETRARRIDSLALIEQIRSLETDGTHVPIVALTASNAEEERRRHREAGCDDFAAKPIRREELLAKVALWTSIGPDRGWMQATSLAG